MGEVRRELLGGSPSSRISNTFRTSFISKNLKNPFGFFLLNGDSNMSKKGETSVQDRGKPQPQKKKAREDKRKKKKLDRAERQKERQT
jgi:hypothetical protein